MIVWFTNMDINAYICKPKQREMVKDIFSKRLKSVRIMKGMSLRDLHVGINEAVSVNALSKYEQGKMFPNSKVLIAISKALDVPMDDLLRPVSVCIDPEKVKYRKKAKLGKKEQASINNLVSISLEKYIEVERMCGESKRFDLSFTDVEVSTYEDAVCVASRFRSALCLGNAPIVNPINLLEGEGVKFIEIEAPETFDGDSFTVDDSFVIVLNKLSCPERIRMSLFHEIGHKVMRFSDGINEKEEEKLCTAFANEVLLPSSVFVESIGMKRKDITIDELRSLQVTYGISIDAMMYKAKSIGIISENRYMTYCIKKNSSTEYKNEATKSMYGKEKSYRFRNLVCRLYANEEITISKCASLLGCSASDVMENIKFV